MTAIDKYVRLEAVGYWFEAGRQEAREVIVSFGDSTLQISDMKDVLLTHWSLLATAKVGTRGEAVIFSPDPDQHEILEIEDLEMIHAISAVTSSMKEPKGENKKRRWWWRGAFAALALWGLSLTPPYIYQAATLLTSPATEARISEQMLDSATAQLGPQCGGWQGLRALKSLQSQLFAGESAEILVFDELNKPILPLAGNRIALSRAALEQAESADVLAVQLRVAWAMNQNNRAIKAFVKSLGPVGALRYLVSRTPPNLASLQDLTPDIADFNSARESLRKAGINASSLEQLAKSYGLNLQLYYSNSQDSVFEFSDFIVLQSICAE